jgi:hypothetical protein
MQTDWAQQQQHMYNDRASMDALDVFVALCFTFPRHETHDDNRWLGMQTDWAQQQQHLYNDRASMDVLDVFVALCFTFPRHETHNHKLSFRSGR